MVARLRLDNQFDAAPLRGVTKINMKKNWILVTVALAMAVIYAIYFTGWLRPGTIHIVSINARVLRLHAKKSSSEAAVIPIIFNLGRPCRLKELKVVVLEEWQTNKNCLPLWHLVADTNSAPITQPFYYGHKLPGMKPEVPGLDARPLEPGVKYRLFVTDGSAKGEHDFQPVARPDSQPGQ